MQAETAFFVKVMWKNYLNKFEVNDMGQVRNAKTKRLYTVRSHYGTAVVNYRDKNTHKAFAVGQAVYKLFINDKYSGRIIHANGNKFDNSVDNLRGNIGQVTDWQVQEFNLWAYASAKHYLTFYIAQLGSWADDYIQETVFLLWRYLYRLKRDEKFVTFASKYARFAFLTIYKREKKQKDIRKLLAKSIKFTEKIL